MITIEIDWQTAQCLMEALEGCTFEGDAEVKAQLIEGLENEAEAAAERRNGDAWEGGFAANH